MDYNVNVFKRIHNIGNAKAIGRNDGLNEVFLPDIRLYYSKSFKPIRIKDDDLESVYSRDSYCTCRWRRRA